MKIEIPFTKKYIQIKTSKSESLSSEGNGFNGYKMKTIEISLVSSIGNGDDGTQVEGKCFECTGDKTIIQCNKCAEKHKLKY